MAHNKYPIPSRGFVRFVGVILLAFDILLMALAVVNFETLGWASYIIFFGSVATIYFPIKAIQTGDPEWVMLDLLLPS